MARTVQTIYQQMLDEKAKYSSLNSLNNTRNTAIWRSIYYSIAVCISVFEQLNDLFKTELLQTAETLPIGTRYWYAQQMLNYQVGYKLQYNRETGRLEYPTIDEESRLIAGANVTSEADTVVIKVCKDDGTGILTNLTEQEIATCRSYIDDFKFAGTITRLISLPGDNLKLSFRVKIDKNKINSLGQLVSDDTIYPVEDAVSSFIYNFGTTSFDDEFLVIKFIDDIQMVDGVINVIVENCECKPASNTEYLDVLTTQFETYKTEAGYLQLTELNITYI